MEGGKDEHCQRPSVISRSNSHGLTSTKLSSSSSSLAQGLAQSRGIRPVNHAALGGGGVRLACEMNRGRRYSGAVQYNM